MPHRRMRVQLPNVNHQSAVRRILMEGVVVVVAEHYKVVVVVVVADTFVVSKGLPVDLLHHIVSAVQIESIAHVVVLDLEADSLLHQIAQQDLATLQSVTNHRVHCYSVKDQQTTTPPAIWLLVMGIEGYQSAR
jgi:hypothetical protein